MMRRVLRCDGPRNTKIPPTRELAPDQALHLGLLERMFSSNLLEPYEQGQAQRLGGGEPLQGGIQLLHEVSHVVVGFLLLLPQVVKAQLFLARVVGRFRDVRRRRVARNIGSAGEPGWLLLLLLLLHVAVVRGC